MSILTFVEAYKTARELNKLNTGQMSEASGIVSAFNSFFK